ncbi:ribosome biogenesis GTP-binding protein YihA/YsxC [Schnuerera sp. xch1]|uniref:ribosome biogenesis GTP-binding protein YihA/YsxC n=1 Tax=Schnuerera sp. xch1 TaxID=2874283 RepID=UPI001CC0065B|nr:ribosome biogenesis GTP-binding protein YihA/YsxC [Schnuerera sp. xch1]MBZ2175850.1 ribosome biogenesis GTP-binding protein YihA/YsxC [Schnuerera sp. xch1]
MKIVKAELERVAVNKQQYPGENLAEIAFVGRSNVGKSSFINSMVNRTKLARTSGKPGKTRTINFYNINNKFRFVDLPGYGYANVSKKEKDKWGRVIEEYLNTRENLIELVLLVDIRHEPTDQDALMYNWIKHFDFTGLVIATKADKISKSKYQQNIKIIKNKLKINSNNLIIPYSSSKKINKEKIWQIFEDMFINDEEQPS